MRDTTRAWEVQSAKKGQKINATKTKLMRIGTKRGDGVLVAGERVEEGDRFTYLGSIASKKVGPDEEIQERIGKTGICNAETSMAIHGTNNQDQAERLWVKYEGGALVWYLHMEADKGIGAAVASVLSIRA